MTPTNVTLTMEGASAGAYEDGMAEVWTAEATRGRVPLAEGTGSTPAAALMVLAQALARMVGGQVDQAARDAVHSWPTPAPDEVVEDGDGSGDVYAVVPVTPEALAAKERLAAKRAAEAENEVHEVAVTNV